MKFGKNKTKAARQVSPAPPPTYRRNRTMTDRTTLPEVSERVKAHHVRKMRRKIGVSIAGLLALSILGVVLIGQFSGKVRVVSTSPDLVKSVNSSEYEKIINQYFKDRPFERFRFTTNYDRLLLYVQSEAPHVQSIRQAGIGGLGVSRYDFRFRQPIASWKVDEVRYYVDSNGVTFRTNYYEEPSVEVKDNSGATIQQGSAIASSRLLSFVGRSISLALEKGVKIDSIEIPADATRLVHLQGEAIPTIKMTIDREVDVQVGDMAAAVKYLQEKGENPEYIDVRVGGRAYYK